MKFNYLITLLLVIFISPNLFGQIEKFDIQNGEIKPIMELLQISN